MKILRTFIRQIIFLSSLFSCMPFFGYGMHEQYSPERYHRPADYAKKVLEAIHYIYEDDLDIKFLAATKRGDFSGMQRFFSLDATVINAQDTCTEKTALHYVISHVAVGKMSSDVVDWLLSHGADPGLCDNDGYVPADVAWENFCLDVVLKIVMHVDKVALESYRLIGVSGFDYTCYYFILKNDLQGLENFLADAATQVGLDVLSPVYPVSPLMLACSLGYNKIVECLVAHGAPYTYFEEEKLFLYEPLFVAARLPNVHVVKCLLNSFPALKSNERVDFITPLAIAFYNWQFNAAETMLECGMPFDELSLFYCQNIFDGREMGNNSEGKNIDSVKNQLKRLMNVYGNPHFSTKRYLAFDQMGPA